MSTDDDLDPIDRLKSHITTPYPEDGEQWSALLKALAGEYDEVETVIDEVETAKHVEDASGGTLDKHGGFFQTERATDQNDDVYRARLKTQLRRFFASGTVDEIAEAIEALLDIDRREIDFREPEDEILVFRPRILADDLGKTGIPPDVFDDLLGDISAAGVNANAILLADSYAITVRYGSAQSEDLGQVGDWFGFDSFDGSGAFGAGTDDDVEGETTTEIAEIRIAYDPAIADTTVEGFGSSSFGAGSFDGDLDDQDVVGETTVGTAAIVVAYDLTETIDLGGGFNSSAFGAGAFDGTDDDEDVRGTLTAGTAATIVAYAEASSVTIEADGFGAGTFDGSGTFS